MILMLLPIGIGNEEKDPVAINNGLINAKTKQGMGLLPMNAKSFEI